MKPRGSVALLESRAGALIQVVLYECCLSGDT